MPTPGGSPRRGTVVEFDDRRGLGVVVEDAVENEAARRYSFHCTTITGSRSIGVGVPVVFSASPGHLGRYEACDVTPAVASMGC